MPPPPHGGGLGWGKRATIVSHRYAASPTLTLPQLGGGDPLPYSASVGLPGVSNVFSNTGSGPGGSMNHL